MIKRNDEEVWWNVYMNELASSHILRGVTELRSIKKRVELLIKIARMFGNDNYEQGTVIRFHGECTKPGINLTYAAIKGGRRWWLTTVNHPAMGYDWERFVGEFLTYAIPDTVSISPPMPTEPGRFVAVSPFFSEEDNAKLLKLQYGEVTS